MESTPTSLAQDPAATEPRILFIVGDLAQGGTAVHLGMICPRLLARGFRPEIFLLSGGGDRISAIRAAGIPVHEPLYKLPSGAGILRRAFRLAVVSVQLWAFLLRQRFNIVHFFLPANYVIGAPVAFLSLHRQLVMSRRSLNFYQSDFPMLAVIEKRLHRCGVMLLGNSRQVVLQLHAEEGVPKAQLGLIYNGIDLHPYDLAPSRHSARNQLGLNDGTLVMSIVANLIPYKGHTDLLEALQLVKDDLPSGWRLLVVGRDDGIGAGLKRASAQMGMGENILFIGPRQDVVPLLAASDIGILSSHEEGFSNALIEGMASGLPMIATDVGGNAEAVLDGVSGLIVPPKNPALLSLAIRHLAINLAERVSMGKAGRHRAATLFSADQCVDNYERFYRAFLSGARVGEIPGVRASDFGVWPETGASIGANPKAGD